MKLSQVKEHFLYIAFFFEVEFNTNVVKLYFYGDSYVTKTSIIMISNLINFFQLRFINDEQMIIEHHIAQADINDDESVVDCIITIKHDLIFHE